MKKRIAFLVYAWLILAIGKGFAQQIQFNFVLKNSQSEAIQAIAQDEKGYIWFTAETSGLKYYDGTNTITYTHNPLNTNSPTSGSLRCLLIDSSNIVWIGSSSGGLDRFDPATNTFTHYRHKQNDDSSLGCDTITAILEDQLGNLWIGTDLGLDLFDKKAGRFSHYTSNPKDKNSLSNNRIGIIYEDRSGTLWVGCSADTASGGLNRLDRTTGKFSQYLHDPNNPASLANNKVKSLLEDSKGNFWVGTAGNGLQILDRNTGNVTHYYYDPDHPEKLSRPYIDDENLFDYITFIKEDSTGTIWIGSLVQGINGYDPATKKTTHYGGSGGNAKDDRIVMQDSISGFNNYTTSGSFISKEGLLWIGTLDGELYFVDPLQTIIPYHSGDPGHSFYYEQNKNRLWIGTEKGLLRKNLSDQSQQQWLNDPHDKYSLANNFIRCIRKDNENKFWIGTEGGLSHFDPATNQFINYTRDAGKGNSLSSNIINHLCFDNNKNIWIATAQTGLDMLDMNTGLFTNYRNNENDKNSLSGNWVNCIASFQKNKIWAGTESGLNLLDTDSNIIRHYLPEDRIKSICIDGKGTVWAGTTKGLYFYNTDKNIFELFINGNTQTIIDHVLQVLEDDQNNLWVVAIEKIVRINATRDNVRIFGKTNGVHENTFYFTDVSLAENGELYIGDQNGYYNFSPGEIKEVLPQLNINKFKIGDEEVEVGPGSVLSAAIWQTKSIQLNYHQRTFSLGFEVVSYTEPGDKKYHYKLENYDDNWHYIGNQQNVFFYDVPPGKYIFHVRGVCSSGLGSEKEIAIEITPPWWRRWWAYSLFALMIIGSIWGFISYRSRKLRKENRILEEKVETRTEELKRSLEQLKSAQSQLIQSEKMASLGELTAGIAHEIQNPLNFVNNFSEVSNELIDEMNDELSRGDIEEAKNIATDIKQNLEKINHHGKRADAIVKGMLQHSRTSSGIKEPTDINALADEFLRLAYHGLRAKDKSFNATMKTDYDESIGLINIVPQDIGRVILNLITNAFYAVSTSTPRPLQGGVAYEPTVTVITKKQLPLPGGGGSTVEISVKDNGPGIPQNILDKIFQPFFTTKPTGQGTGLGLSLSYDIVKAHGGELKVETKDGEGTEFIIILPQQENKSNQ